MYTKHINILHLFLLFPQVAYKFVQEEIIDKVDTPFEQTTLILNCWSEHYIDQIGPVFEEVLKYNFFKVIVLVDINSEKNFQQLPSHLQDRIELEVIDSIHMLSARIVWGDRCTDSWNLNATKGFFPTGQLGRYNRISLLEKLYRASALSTLVWTVPKSIDQLPIIMQYYQYRNGVPDDFDEFYSYITTNAVTAEQGISPEAFTATVPFFLTHDHPVDLYNDASFILVAETSSEKNVSPLITEKIPLAIMSHRPYILAGYPGTLKRLQDQGFKTFNEHLPYPNYDSVVDNDTRLTQIVENVRAFPKVLQEYKEEIQYAINHNYLRLNQIADNVITQLENFAVKHNITYTSLEEEFGLNPWVSQHYVHLTGLPNITKPKANDLRIKEHYYIKESINTVENTLWLEHYNNIRDANWPTIYSREEFDLLPDEIKTECLTQFNFHSKLRYMDG